MVIRGSGNIYSVREAVMSDAAGVLAVLAEDKAAPPPQPRCPPGELTEQQLAVWDHMMGTDGLAVYIAEVDSEAVGTLSLLVVPNLTYGCRPTAFIEPVVVKYAHRRRGVAQLMLRRALSAARAASCFKVQLLSHKRHAEDGAHDLYRSVGFEAEAEGFRQYFGAAPVR
jgi:GNAT superfamily N-acetyltransferase